MIGARDFSEPHQWDAAQHSVINGGAAERWLVDAGPGTGKTAVACARLGNLIRTGQVRPSQTWMISFTRTAVAEIRSRLQSYVGEAAYAVKVATVDAHAWTIHSGYDEQASLTGSYDQNVERVLDLVRGDDDVLDYLQNVEHLVVDEAQDLVGVRAELVEAIISKLAPECGVTIFSDAAQAIYGFSEDEGAGADGYRQALVECLGTNPAYGFKRARLEAIYRTSSPGLRTIFAEVRATVLAGLDAGPGLFSRVRESVANSASSDLQRTELDIASLAPGSLVLFRTRSEALESSQFCDAPHSLRLSGYGAHLPAWIAICFHDWVDPFMSPADFELRWRTRLVAGALAYDSKDAWSRLVQLGGTLDGSLDMARLRRGLARRSVPVDLAVTDYGLPGPVVGTIHASKGREADSVILLMPDGAEFDSETSEEEETRVLFVGSTRARSSLRVADARKYGAQSLDSGRCFRRLSRKGQGERVMFEVGRENDLTIEGLVGTGHIGEKDALSAQSFLARGADQLMRFSLVRGDAALNWSYQLVNADDDQRIGLTSMRVQDDLWAISRILGNIRGEKYSPATRINWVKGLGSRTLVVDPDDVLLSRLHEPWSRSGFVLAPRLAAFTMATFWRQR